MWCSSGDIQLIQFVRNMACSPGHSCSATALISSPSSAGAVTTDCRCGQLPCNATSVSPYATSLSFTKVFDWILLRSLVSDRTRGAAAGSTLVASTWAQPPVSATLRRILATILPSWPNIVHFNVVMPCRLQAVALRGCTGLPACAGQTC